MTSPPVPVQRAAVALCSAVTAWCVLRLANVKFVDLRRYAADRGLLTEFTLILSSVVLFGGAFSGLYILVMHFRQT